MTNLYSQILESMKNKECLFYLKSSTLKLGLHMMLITLFILFIITLAYIFRFENLRNLIKEKRFYEDIYIISNDFFHSNTVYYNVYIFTQICFWSFFLLIYIYLYIISKKNVNKQALIHQYISSRLIIYCCLILFISSIFTYLDNSYPVDNIGELKANFNQHIKEYIYNYIHNCDYQEEIKNNTICNSNENLDAKQKIGNTIAFLIIKKLEYNEYLYEELLEISWVKAIDYDTNTLFDTSTIDQYNLTQDVIYGVKQKEKEINECISKIKKATIITSSKQFYALIIQMIVFMLIAFDLFHKKK